MLKRMRDKINCWWHGHFWSTPVILEFRAPKDEPLTVYNGVPLWWRWCIRCGQHQNRWGDEHKWRRVEERQIPINLSGR